MTRVRSRVVSGQFLVVLLLVLGISATALMFVYWEQHTRPFRGLREAIGREFRHSRPNVEGGRHKGRGPMTLRITMSVDFPPGEETAKSNQIVDRLREIVQQHTDVSQFDKVEFNLVQFVPQELAKTRTFTWVPNESEPPDKSDSP
jgi:hypothetical protein